MSKIKWPAMVAVESVAEKVEATAKDLERLANYLEGPPTDIINRNRASAYRIAAQHIRRLIEEL